MKQTLSCARGNALLFVLMAVALLGILTAVISRTSTSVEQTGNVEQARVKAAALLRYTQGLEVAIQQMVTNGGTSESVLEFAALGEGYDNPNCAEEKCDPFKLGGGGMAYRNAADILAIPGFTGKWAVSGQNRVYQMGCNDESESCNDLLLVIKDIPKMLCLEINRLGDTDNPGGDAPRQNGIILETPYTGTFSQLHAHIIGGPDANNESPQLQGKSSGCAYDFTNTKSYVFYQVLLAR